MFIPHLKPILNALLPNILLVGQRAGNQLSTLKVLAWKEPPQGDCKNDLKKNARSNTGCIEILWQFFSLFPTFLLMLFLWSLVLSL